MMREARDIPVEELLPQRAPMVMVDRLLEVEGSRAVSELEIKSGNIFLEKGLFNESGVLENMAQTAAAMNGYHALAGGNTVKNGYIGAIKDLQIHALPAVGEVLTTEVEEEHRVMGASVVRGSCRCGGRLLARCEIRVFMEE